MCVLPACMSLQHIYALLRSQKRVSDPPQLRMKMGPLEDELIVLPTELSHQPCQFYFKYRPLYKYEIVTYL